MVVEISGIQWEGREDAVCRKRIPEMYDGYRRFLNATVKAEEIAHNGIHDNG